MTTLVVFEDAGAGAFEILAALRGVFDLRCGGRTLLERFRAACGDGKFVFLVRADLEEVVREQHPEAGVGVAALAAAGGPLVFVNARLLLLGHDWQRLTAGPATGFALLGGDVLVTARCEPSAAIELARLLVPDAATLERPLAERLASTLPVLARLQLADERQRVQDGSLLLDHGWDLVHQNGRAIVDDFRCGGGAGIAPGALLYPGVHLLQDAAIRIGSGCRIKPGVVLDAEDGPITLEDEVEIQPGAVLRGPVHVGPRCILKAGAKIHEGTSLGPGCKVGGEVEESVVQGWSNKQHEGFLGHAWLGEWVNLGADTNNSDLKNNYSSVRVWESGRSVDTGRMFVGLLCGDHVKSAIDTQFNTGTVVGLASQIFGSGFPPKFVPPFSWGGAAGLERYDLERALGTARAVMARRRRDLGPAYEQAFRRVFETWSDARRGA